MNLKDLNIEISFSDSTISFNNVDIVVHNKISLNNKILAEFKVEEIEVLEWTLKAGNIMNL